MTARPITLVISNIEWGFAWQRHQTLASLFARDSDVVFCEIPGIRRIGIRDAARVFSRLRTLNRKSSDEPTPAGVRVVRPFVLPATNRLFHAFNRRLLRRFLRREPSLAAGVELILNYSASRSALELIGCVPHRRLVYDCTDDWLAVRDIPACLPGDERVLLAQADFTLVPSRALEERKHPLARRLIRIPHGALVERFLVAPREPRAAGPRSLLYYGHLHEQHLDFAAIDALAAARPEWRVKLVGPVKTPHAFPANVTVIPQQPHERLREYVAEADVLLLPYALNDYTRAVLPAKTYECLATGRPIVAAPLPELIADFSAHMSFATKPAEWAEIVEQAWRKDSAPAREARVALALANTWESRYERIRGLLT
jgi:glycosyltransferase involved in cell wall biosynthesis